MNQIEPTIKWAKLVRTYIALQKDEYLIEAIEEAERIGESEISSNLKAMSGLKAMPGEDRENVMRRIGKSVQLFQIANRQEEGLTLAMINIMYRAILTEQFRYYAVEHQIKALQAGLKACEHGIQFSQVLHEPACEAFFFLLMAKGFQEIDDVVQAKIFSFEALGKYRELTKTQPQVYSSAIAKTLNILGNVQNKLRELEAAKSSYDEALSIYRSLAKTQPHIYNSEVAMTLNNLGIIQRGLRELKAAKTSYNEALGIKRELVKTQFETYNPTIAGTLNNLGAVLIDLGELEAAKNVFNEAFGIERELAKTQFETYTPVMAGTLNNLGIVQRELRELEAAKNSFLKALGIYRSLTKMQSHSYKSALAKTLSNLGAVQWDLGELEAAKNSGVESLIKYMELARTQPQIYNVDVAMTLTNLGNVQKDLRELEMAKNSFLKALDKFRELAGIHPQIYNSAVAKTLNNLGTVEFELGELEAAKNSYNKALSIYRSLARTSLQIYHSDVAMTVSNLGYLFIDQGDYKKALGHFEEVKKFTEDSLERVIDITRRKAVFQEFMTVYRGLLICYIKLGRWNEALEIAEQGKSRSVADLLNLKAIRPKNINNLPEIEDLADRYEQAMVKAQQLESWLTALYKYQGNTQKPTDDSNGDELLRYENEISKFSQSLENVTNQQRENDHAKNEILKQIKDYENDFPPKTELLKQNEIYELSKKSGRTIVLFRVTDKGTYVFIIFPNGKLEHLEKEEFTDQRLRLLTIKWLTPYYKFLEKLRMGVNDRTLFDAFKNGMNPILREIYDELIKDVHDRLKAKKVNEVLFVPSGDLAVFPLHACCWEDEKKQLHYLLDDESVDGKLMDGLTISYATSVSVFKRAWELKRKGTEKFLFVTNPDRSLKGADSEVDGIKDIFSISEKDLRHEEATKQIVKNEMQNGYSFYHFSCHGNYDRQNAFDSALKMAFENLAIEEEDSLTEQDKKKLREEKRSFRMKEIMETSLEKAWLTTLSACETGVVNFEETSDEHYGLPLAFIFAGCPSIWGTLWSVRDNATSELMKLAYKNIKLGTDKAEALRKAQIKLKENSKYNSPYYWAGFQHYGV